MSAAKGSLREVMPTTAQFIDELRKRWNPEAVDRMLLRGKAGKGGAYLAEVGPDGVFREFGSSPSGRRCVARDGRAVWSDGAN